MTQCDLLVKKRHYLGAISGRDFTLLAVTESCNALRPFHREAGFFLLAQFRENRRLPASHPPVPQLDLQANMTTTRSLASRTHFLQ